MKKILSALIILLICTNAFLSVFADSGKEVTRITPLTSQPSYISGDDFYECEFELDLDQTYIHTWVHGLSKIGTLHVKIQRCYNTGFISSPPLIVTFYLPGGKEIKYMPTSSNSALGSKGSYEINSRGPVIVGEEMLTYAYNPKDNPLRITLERNDDVPSIKFFLIDNSWTQGKGFLPVSTVLEVDNEKLTEKGTATAMQGIFNVNGEVKQEIISGSEEYYEYLKELEKKKAEQGDDDPVDYSDLSTDPRRWDDKEKSIEAYGTYRDDNGVFHGVRCLRGYFMKAERDYRVNITAVFNINDNSSDTSKIVSSDGNLRLTYFNVVPIVDGTERFDQQLVKVSGDLGEKWFLSGTLEAAKPDPNVEIRDTNLHDDQSIYLGFIPLDKFENHMMEFTAGVGETLGFTFNYNDNTKTVLNSIEIRLDGVTRTVRIDDVNYKGGFISYFLQIVYPETWQDIAEGLGLTI